MESDDSYLHSKDEKQNLKVKNNKNIKYSSKELIPNNFTNASFLSKIFYFWAKPAISLANKRPLTNIDICNISPSQSVLKNISSFKKIFYEKSSNKNSNYPLFTAIVALHYKSLLFLFCLNMTDVGLEYIRIFFSKKSFLFFLQVTFFQQGKYH